MFLVDHLSRIAGRVGVGDIVGACPQTRLGGDDPGCGVVQHSRKRHGSKPSQPATLAQSRRFLPGLLGKACARPPKKSNPFKAASSAATLGYLRCRKTWASGDTLWARRHRTSARAAGLALPGRIAPGKIRTFGESDIAELGNFDIFIRYLEFRHRVGARVAERQANS